jgi:Raf kinase inhibitor-like YbhB/YbcL family protein
MLIGPRPTAPWPGRVPAGGTTPRNPPHAGLAGGALSSPQTAIVHTPSIQPATASASRMAHSAHAPAQDSNPGTPLASPQVLHRCWTPRCVQRNPRGPGARLWRGWPQDVPTPHTITADGACGRATRWAVRRLAGVSGRSIPAAAAAAALFLASGCGLIGGPSKVLVAVPDNITVTSPDLSGKQASQAFSCHGAGRTPAIHWSGAPAGTKSLALVMDDSAAPITPYIFWIVFNIGPQSSDIPAGQLPPGARRAGNSKGTIGYDPPCPANPGHVYRFTVYALDRKLSLPSGVSAKTAWMAIAAAAIARGRLASVINP